MANKNEKGTTKMTNINVLYEIKSLEKAIVRTFLNNKDVDIPENIFPSPTQFQIIECILESKDQEINQKELENILNLRRATISGVLQTMEKSGLIKRVTNKNDIRTKKIILNEKTKKIFERKRKAIKNTEKKIIKNISKEDLETFLKVLNIMKENIKEEEGQETL